MLNRGSGGILCCVDLRALHPLRVPLLGLPARPFGQYSVAPVPLVSVLRDVQSQPSLQCMELNRLGTVLPSEPTVEGTTQKFSCVASKPPHLCPTKVLHGVLLLRKW